ncbi:MAG: hypothetical protein JRD68_02915 [Deltaproteobacteria bacterium]|nr:hypothetical protein [Deltaproteobacteria bacterium]
MKSKFFNRLRKRALIGGTVILFILSFASFSWASPITYKITGTTFNSISAEIVMNYAWEVGDGGKGIGLLSFKITNDSTAAASSLTAFAFNVPLPPGVMTHSISVDDHDPGDVHTWFSVYESIDGAGGIKTPGQFGTFDMAGVTSTNDKFGGGKVSEGIGQGETFDFIFTLTGLSDNPPYMKDLVTEDFNILSNIGDDPNATLIPIVARFQAIDFGNDDDFSDIGTGTMVPIPGAIVLLGSGIFGLVGFRRKFSS